MQYFSTILTQSSSINQNNTLINKLCIRILIVRPLMKGTHTYHMPSEIMCIHAKHSNYQFLVSSCQENYATTKCVFFFLTHWFIVETFNPLMINSLGYLLSSYLNPSKQKLPEPFTHHSFKFTSFSSFDKHFCMLSLDTKYSWALVIQKSER